MNELDDEKMAALEGQNRIDEAYNTWSKKLSEYGIQAIYAIIAANWAVYGKASEIISNKLSLLSIALCIASLIANIFITWRVTEKHYERCTYARKNFDSWLYEYRHKHEWKYQKWPYTVEIETWAVAKRFALSVGPIVAGLFFVFSGFF